MVQRRWMKAERARMAAFLLVVLIWGTAACAMAETLTVRADPWPPYNMEPGQEKEGYIIDILKAIFEPAGIQIDYQTMPWSRAIRMTERGEYDAIVGALKTEVPAFIFPDEPCGMSKYAFYIKTGIDWEYRDVESLAPVKLAVIADYSYNEIDDYIQRAVKDRGNVVVTRGESALKRNIKLLLAGSVDVIIDDINVVPWTLKEMDVPKGDLQQADRKAPAKAIYAAFSPNRPNSQRYARMLTNGIRELRSSGRLKRILEAYNLEDWKEK